MLQDTLNNVTAARERLQSRVQPQIEQASNELKKVLKDLGVNVEEELSLSQAVEQIRERNGSIKELSLNLDAATYDLRKKLWWNANMMSAYVVDQAGKTYETEVKPKIQAYRDTAEARAKSLLEQVRTLAPKQDAKAENE